MTQTTSTDFILWGFMGQGPACFARPIKITGGTLRHCNAEKRMRKDEGWTFGVYKQGTAPVALRLQAAAG